MASSPPPPPDPLFTLRGHTSEVYAVKFHPNRPELLASGCVRAALAAAGLLGHPLACLFRMLFQRPECILTELASMEITVVLEFVRSSAVCVHRAPSPSPLRCLGGTNFTHYYQSFIVSVCACQVGRWGGEAVGHPTSPVPGNDTSPRKRCSGHIIVGRGHVEVRY